MPGASIGQMTQVMPRWRGASGSVRTRSSWNCATCAKLVHTFCPLTTRTVALDDGARLEARQVGARVRLREALAPDHLAAQDRREVGRLLLLRPARDEGRASVVEPDEERRDVGRAGARIFLAPDELLHERRAAAAVRARPRDARPAAVVHAPLPGLVVRGAPAELGRARRARQ